MISQINKGVKLINSSTSLLNYQYWLYLQCDAISPNQLTGHNMIPFNIDFIYLPIKYSNTQLSMENVW